MTDNVTIDIVTDAGAAEFLLSSDWADDDDGAALSAEFWGVYVNDEWWMHHHEVNDRARRLVRAAVAAERGRLAELVEAARELDRAAVRLPDGRRRCYSPEHLAEGIDAVKDAVANLTEPVS